MCVLKRPSTGHVCNSKYNAHTQPLFKNNKVIQFDDLFKLQCVKLVYKKFHGKLPSYHSEQLVINKESRQLNTRQKYDVNISTANDIFSRTNTINYKIGKSWNELSFETKKTQFKTQSNFTKHIKGIYTSKYSDICNISNCYTCKNNKGTPV